MQFVRVLRAHGLDEGAGCVIRSVETGLLPTASGYRDSRGDIHRAFVKRWPPSTARVQAETGCPAKRPN